jgi:hypothetical protein
MEHRVPMVQAILELGLSDEDALVAFFSSKLMIPRVRPAVLERVSAETIACVPEELARRFGVVPVSMDDAGNLTIAMADPTDLEAVSAVASHTNAYLVRAVASGTSLDAALERHYGGGRIVAGPDNTSPDPDSTHPAMRLEDVADAAPPPLPDSPALDDPESRHTVMGMPDSSSIPPAAPDRSRAHTPSSWNPPLTDQDAEPTPLSPEAFTRVLPRLVSASDRDEITRLLLDFLGGGFSRVLLFVNSRGELRGHDARGSDLMVDAVKQVRIPTAQASLFSEVLERKKPYFGRMPSTRDIDVAFAQALGGLGGNVLCLPIAIGPVVPLFLFAHGSNHPIDPRSIGELADGVSAALARIIAAKRRKS